MLSLIIDHIRYFLNSYFPKKDSKDNKLDSNCTLNNFKIGNSSVTGVLVPSKWPLDEIVHLLLDILCVVSP
jgi:hypothetical protein